MNSALSIVIMILLADAVLFTLIYIACRFSGRQWGCPEEEEPAPVTDPTLSHWKLVHRENYFNPQLSPYRRREGEWRRSVSSVSPVLRKVPV